MPAQKIRRDLVPIVSDYANTFGTDSGLRVLSDLEKSFNQDIYTKGDPYDTHVRIGSREVVERIKYMISLSGLEVEKEDEDEQSGLGDV